MTWAERAACRDVPVAEFFKEAGGRRGDGMPLDVKRAKRYCAMCPVRRECLGYALKLGRAPQRFHLPPNRRWWVTMRNECGDRVARAMNQQNMDVTTEEVATVDFTIETAGIWGGTTLEERRRARHAPTCVNHHTCTGCRSLAETVDALDTEFRVQVRGAGLIGPGEEIAV